MTWTTYQPQPQPPQPKPKKTPLAVKLVVIAAILIWVGGCGAIIAAIGSEDPATVPAAVPAPASTTAPAPEPTVPFMMMLLRGKAYLRMQQGAAQVPVLQHASQVFHRSAGVAAASTL